MLIGKVTGSIFSTRKTESLVGYKFMIVSLQNNNGTRPDYIVAVDTLGAGINDTVLVTTGDSARYGCPDIDVPVDAVIVGIIDQSNYTQN